MEVYGPSEFTFSVPNSGGVTLEPDVRAIDEGISITLEQVTVAATSVEVSLGYAGLDEEWDWLPITEVRQGGREYPVGGGEWQFGTVEGTDDPSGHWTVAILELVGFSGAEQQRISGNWELPFEVP